MVIINLINFVEVLFDKEGIEIYLFGGKLEKEYCFLYGVFVIEKFLSYYVDKVLIGVVGIFEYGIMIVYEEDGMVK